MISKISDFFVRNCYKGSFAYKNENNEIAFYSNFSFYNEKIFKAIFEIDPDYTYVLEITEGYINSTKPLLTVSCKGDINNIIKNLDEAILKGLGHYKVFREKETNSIIFFGYSLEELF